MIVGPFVRLRLTRVILLSVIVATTAILTFLYCWNEFLFALSFTLGPERHTVPVAIALAAMRRAVLAACGKTVYQANRRPSGRCSPR